MFKFILLFFIFSSYAYAGTHVQTVSSSAIDKSIVRMSGTSGEIVQNSTAVLDDNGNLGVGTTTPLYMLDIKTLTEELAFNPQSAVSDLIISHADDDPAPSILDFYKARGSLSSPVSVNLGDVLGTQRYNGYDGASYVPSFSLRAVVDDTVASDNILSSLEFVTFIGIIGTERMRITSAGNVGINSTLPGTKLDVQGIIRTTDFQLSTDPSPGYVLTSNSVGVGTWQPAGAGTPGGGLGAVQYNSPIGTFAGDATKFYFNGTNVGIGTTITPTTFNVANADGNNMMDVYDINDDYHAFKIDGVGTVGIGTKSPDSSVSLDVYGTTSVHNGSLILTQNNAAVAFRVLDQNGGTGFAVNSPSFGSTVTALYNVGIGTSFNITDAKLMVLGNVGIGTFHPGTILDVQGTIRAPASGWNIGIGTASATRVCITNTTWSACP